jgi:hypothetical protein
MDPSTEQLIRDYLNRVAVAARRSMGPDELRAFLARQRESIERQCTAHGMATAADVGHVLSGLGEPEALVDLEHARLAAARHAQGPGEHAPAPASPGPGGTSTDPAAAVADDEHGAGEPRGKGAGASTGRLLRFTGRPRRLARQRDPRPPAADDPGTEPGHEATLTAANLAVQRRPVTARRRPAEILPVKAAVRPRGPQGRDSPILQPVKQGRTPWLDKAVGAGPRNAAAPAATEQPGAALAFVPQQGPIPRHRPTAVPKFHPVREPAEAPKDFPERKPPAASSRPSERRPAIAAGSPPERTPGPQPSSGQEPAFRAESGPRPGSRFRPGTASGPAPAFHAEPESGQEPKFPPDQVIGPGAAPGAEPVFHSEPGRAQKRVFRPASDFDPVFRPELAPGPAPSPEPGGGTPLPADPAARSGSTQWVTAGLAAVLMRASALARQHPLESVAIILLGLGGLIYPLVWLVGVVIALPSRLWNIRDKWLGLAAPAILTIVGSAGLATGASHPTAGAYLHAALTIGGYLIRAGAVLGAAYLAWRVNRGRRAPAQPPWRRRYR